ncbi:hypothetical protein SAMD00019534_000730 [Acytostelium subglobosum LB1]|uniref:hypothetical protein n=1 Tax=Acytostelium subglobosum LB1 TaxID=1410327 RepID=UPI00064495EC|nr:hypothetical protein SAMD00019534_000730 [Acytostelium subglobosum LB1]GAM16898.1 hypothetical protein SAMD00019534_000730 [Acytostelium subglobosum LB1]|eukprot:XP_012758960.1 hypothetical protein SAMD00019534_000730 [Acytostelium subglobosum LB1]
MRISTAVSINNSKSTLSNNDKQSIADVLMRQMFVGPVQSPLLVSYLRYALATKMVEYGQLFNSVAQHATPTKPAHFQNVLLILFDVVRLIQQRSQIKSVSIDAAHGHQHVDGCERNSKASMNGDCSMDITTHINGNVNGSGNGKGKSRDKGKGKSSVGGGANGLPNGQHTDGFTLETKRKRGDDDDNDDEGDDGGMGDDSVGGGPDRSILKKRKNQNSYQSIYGGGDMANVDVDMANASTSSPSPVVESSMSDATSSNDRRAIYIDHLTGLCRVISLLLRTILDVLNDHHTQPTQSTTTTTTTSRDQSPTAMRANMPFENALQCLNVLAGLSQNQRLTSYVQQSQREVPSAFGELTQLLSNIQTIVDNTYVAGDSEHTVSWALRTSIVSNHPNLLSATHSALLQSQLPTSEIQALHTTNLQQQQNDMSMNLDNNNNMQQSQSAHILALQLWFDEEVAGTNISMSPFDALYKFDWLRSVKAIAPTNYFFELLRIAFQRMTANNDTQSSEFRRIKALLLIKLPLYIEATSPSTNAQCMVDALYQISQIPSLFEMISYTDNVLLAILLVMVKRNLVDVSSLRERFPLYQSEIDTAEIEMQQGSPSVPNSQLPTNFTVHSQSGVARLKDALMSLNSETSVQDMQDVTASLRQNLVNPSCDYQDKLMAALFEVLDTVDPYGNRKTLMFLLATLSEPLVIDMIDVHGYIIQLFMFVIKCCDSLGRTTNDSGIHSYFSIPFALLSYLVTLYRLKYNQYNLDLLTSRLRLTQDTTYENPFIKWIYDSFKDSEINFSSNHQEGMTSEDVNILQILVSNNRDSFVNEVLNNYSPWQFVHKLPQLIFLLIGCYERLLTTPESIKDILTTVIDVVPYSSLIIFQYLAKNPSIFHIFIDPLLSIYLNPDGSENDHYRFVNFNLDQEQFQINHHICETLNITLFPIMQKFPLPSTQYHSVVFTQVANSYQKTPMHLTQLTSPQATIQEIFDGFMVRLNEVPKDLIINIINKTDVVQFVNIVAKKVLHCITSTNDNDSISTSNTIRIIELGGFILGNVVGVESIPILFNSIVPASFNSSFNTSQKAQYLSYFCLTVFVHCNCSLYIQQNHPYMSKTLSKFFRLISDSANRVVQDGDPLNSFIISLISLFIHLNKSLNLANNNNNNNNMNSNGNGNDNDGQASNKHLSIFSILSHEQLDELSISIAKISNHRISPSNYEYRGDHHLYNIP